MVAKFQSLTLVDKSRTPSKLVRKQNDEASLTVVSSSGSVFEKPSLNSDQMISATLKSKWKKNRRNAEQFQPNRS